jgi:hypothetical protein
MSGWYSLAIGKIFHHSEKKLQDSSEVWSEPSYTYLKGLKRPPAYPDPGKGSWLNSLDVDDEHYADGVVARKAARIIKEQLGTKPEQDTSPMPWFFAVGFYRPVGVLLLYIQFYSHVNLAPAVSSPKEIL